MRVNKNKIYLIISSVVLGVPTSALAACDPATVTSPAFCSMFCDGGVCANYDAWINGLWNWGLTIIIPLSVLMLAAAGVIYSTSAGNPDRIGMAKKMLFGVLSGLGLLILAKVLLGIIGVG